MEISRLLEITVIDLSTLSLCVYTDVGLLYLMSQYEENGISSGEFRYNKKKW